MTKNDLQIVLSTVKVALAFVNAFAGILAAYPGPELAPLARLFAAATVAGCGAALLFLNPPGDSNVKAVADELEQRMKARPARG